MIFSGLKKTESQTWGRIGSEKNRVQEILGLFFYRSISPPCLGLCFFQTTKNYKFSLYPFLTFFSTRVLESHLGGLKAACIGPALSKFRPNVGDRATYWGHKLTERRITDGRRKKNIYILTEA